MLGTNDLKCRYSLAARDVSRGVEIVVKSVHNCDVSNGGRRPDVLLISPPPFSRLSEFADTFHGAEEKSRLIGAFFREVAHECGCAFLDAGEHIQSSDRDGIHFDSDAHAVLGTVVAGEIRSTFL